MINEGGIAKVEEHIADALKRGATLVTGGKRLSGSSFILKINHVTAPQSNPHFETKTKALIRIHSLP